MIGVMVHTFNGGYGDYTQLLGIYEDLDMAKAEVEKLIEFYHSNYLTASDDSLKEVKDILRPEYFPVDLNRTYSIRIDDEDKDFDETQYDTDIPTIYLGGYSE